MKEIKEALYSHLVPTLQELNFKFLKGKTCFVRTTKTYEHTIRMSMNAKYGFLSISMSVSACPLSLNKGLNKVMALPKHETFCFHTVVPREYYKVVQFKDAYHMTVADMSLDIPEKEYLEEKGITLAQFMHPSERIKRVADNILEIVHEFALPYLAQYETEEVIPQIFETEGLEGIGQRMSTLHMDGWKLLYWFRENEHPLLEQVKAALEAFYEGQEDYLEKLRAVEELSV